MGPRSFFAATVLFVQVVVMAPARTLGSTDAGPDGTLVVPSPVGSWRIAVRQGAVVRCTAAAAAPRTDHPLQERITAWFEGHLDALADVAVHWVGTPFQDEVWTALAQVPPGTTVTYGEIADRLGRPRTAARAVGAAVGANPLLLFVPCHRIVGSGGRLVGYAGGLERKRWLLAHELRLGAQGHLAYGP